MDLLDENEKFFVRTFPQLDRDSQCLLIRMASRKGVHFRADKLIYEEIIDPANAAQILIKHQFVNVDTLLDITELANMVTKTELITLFDVYLSPIKSSRKEIFIGILSDYFPEQKTWSDWTGGLLGKLYYLNVQAIINRLLLLFFGNPYQSLTDFVLQDLGLYHYEKYDIDKQHRLFNDRAEILQYQQLLLLREQLSNASDNDALINITLELPAHFDNPTMERRRARLVNQLAYEFERNGEIDIALQLYRQSTLTPSRERQIRLLEKTGEYQQAWQLLNELINNPMNEHELQVAQRMIQRLAKKNSMEAPLRKPIKNTEQRIQLPHSIDEDGYYYSVEEIVRRHIHVDIAPCIYVENGLINSLFGLWLWPEMFRSVPGAFTHPFQDAPLDLYHEDFQKNRHGILNLWKLLDEQTYQTHILTIWKQKKGIANQFVNWQLIDEEILCLALECIPAYHLKIIFERLLFDLKENRNGFPDLIQFFPASKNYRMIEVKGPNDKIQDNQQRWLNFFSAHNIPAEICYITWA